MPPESSTDVKGLIGSYGMRVSGAWELMKEDNNYTYVELTLALRSEKLMFL